MTFDFLESGISLRADDYVSGADEAIAASEDLADSTDDAAGSLDGLGGVARGIGIAAVGGGIQSVTDSTRDLRESLGRTSVSMGLTQDETEGLARSLSDASFPLDDVTGTMDELAQIGVDTEAEMRDVAMSVDLLADATGTSAQVVASDLAPAIRAMDGDLSALEDDADAFTLAVRETGLEMSDLSSTIEQLDFDEIEELGLDAASTAQIIGEFGEQSGFTGRQLRSNFRQAVEAADGDVQELGDELGISAEQMAELADETSAGSEQTTEFADAANDSLGTMDRVRAGFDDAKLAVGGMMGPLEAAGPMLMATGGLSSTLAAINSGMLAPSFAAVSAASLPVSAPLLAIGAGLGVIGGAVAAIAWRSDAIDPMEAAGWAAERAGDGIDWLRGRILDGADAVRRFYPPVVLAREVYERNLFGIASIVDGVFGFIGDSIDWLVDKIDTIPGVNIGGDDVDVNEDAIEDEAEAGGDAAVRGLESPDYGSAGEQAGTSFGDGLEAGIADSFTLRDAESLVDERLPELQSKMEEEGELWGEEAAEFAALQDAQDAIDDGGDISDLDADIVADLVEMQAENERAEEAFRDDVLEHLAPQSTSAPETPPNATASTSQPETAPAPSGSSSTGASKVELTRETIRDLTERQRELVEGLLLTLDLEIDDRELDRLIEDRVDAAITN